MLLIFFLWDLQQRQSSGGWNRLAVSTETVATRAEVTAA
jgi:hypothetical protein